VLQHRPQTDSLAFSNYNATIRIPGIDVNHHLPAPTTWQQDAILGRSHNNPDMGLLIIPICYSILVHLICLLVLPKAH
jgi:hypothetical protein